MINLIKNSKINVYFLLVFLILFIISTFRNGLGTDYYAYADLYQSPDGKSTDFLFNLFFIEIPRLFSKNEITFFLITSFVVNFFFLKKIFNTSVFIVISVFLYLTQFYFISFNAVRQFIAISLFFYYANLIIKKK